MKKLSLFFAIIVIISDQLSKSYIMTLFKDKISIIKITNFLNIVLVQNKGMSFGFFNSGKVTWILTIISIIITIGLFFWLWQTTSIYINYALGLIIGGAIGNIIDRIRFSSVIDFLDFHVLEYHWWAFNVADSAICIGIIILLLDGLFPIKEKYKNNL